MSQAITLELSALCQLFPRPQIMTGVLREILIQLFGRENNVDEQDLRQLVWKEGVRTAILIESYHAWNPSLIAKRPAIILRRNTYTREPRAIDDRYQGQITMESTRTTFWQGSHTLFCISRSGAQAELLSTEVAQALTTFGAAIRDAVNLHRFGVMEIGGIAELEEVAEHFVVPVTVAYAYQQSWITRPYNMPILKSLSLKSVLEG